MACKPTSSPTLSRKPSFFTSSRVQQTPALTRRDPQKVREKRRFEFLNKVKQKREEKNFENRFEQLQQLDAIAERKAWEQQQEQQAAQWSLDPNHAGEEMDGEEEIVYDFLSQEEQEFEAMMFSMKEQPSEDATSTMDYCSTGYIGDDEEEYDELLMEALLQVEGENSAVEAPTLQEGDMDMSTG